MKPKIAMRNKHKLKWTPYRGMGGAIWGKLEGEAIPVGFKVYVHNNPNKSGRSYKWTVYATYNDGSKDSIENTRRGFNEALEKTLEEIT